MDGPITRVCYFLAPWTGSLRAVVIMSAGGGRQQERNMTVPSREGQVPGTDAARGLLSGCFCGVPAAGPETGSLAKVEQLWLRTGWSRALETLPKGLFP